jgi:hypothetical protein
MFREHPGVDHHPDQQDSPEQSDERPAPAEPRHAVGHALTEGHRRFEVPVHHATHSAAPRDLRDDRMLDLRELPVFGLEIADELLGAILLQARGADAALPLPLRTVRLDEIDDAILELLRRAQ